jgi:predicted patatin/cPLA2 family phospholipase
MTHPVIDALARRPRGARIALVVEGGGMRGAVSGGMVLALDELGLTRAFHAAYGASAGALNAMWLISGRVRDGIPTWVDPRLVHALIDRRRALGGRPVVDVRTLVETRYEQLSPGLFDAVLASPTELHPLATEVATGTAVDLAPTIVDPPSLRRALRASAALPLLAGPPVAIDGRRFVDAGLAAAIPVRAAVGQGATHVLVLRSRRAGEAASAPGRVGAALGAALLRRIDPAVARAFLARAPREAADEALLARHEADPDLRPHILSVRPAPDSPVPARLDKDVAVVAAGLEAGRVALHAAFDAWA